MLVTACELRMCAVQRTGSHLPKHTFFGKPNAQPYRLAEAALTEQAQQLGLLRAESHAGEQIPLIRGS